MHAARRECMVPPTSEAVSSALRCSERASRLQTADLCACVCACVCLHALAADFIKDDQDRWWMLQLKSFRLTPECEAHMAKLNAAKMVGFFLIHRSHSISFTRAQGIPKYKIGFGREEDGSCCCPCEPRGRNHSSCSQGTLSVGVCVRGVATGGGW